MEEIGLTAAFKDAAFRAGIARYNAALGIAADNTDAMKLTMDALDAGMERVARSSPEVAAVLRGMAAEFEDADGDAMEFIATLGDMIDELDEVEQQSGQAADGSKKFVDSLAGLTQLQAFQALQGIASSIGRVGDKMLGLAKDSVMTAARVEELGFVLNNLAEQNDLSVSSLNEAVQAIRDQGIQADVAYNLVSQFTRGQLDLAKAGQLARVAQDAAVISMEDSSQALAGLLHGIMTLQPEMLRYRGIIVDLQGEYKRWADANGRTTLSLTSLEKQQIALDAVIAQGASIAGTYESAMESASKQLRSMPRYVADLKAEMGESLLPVYSDVIFAAKDMMKWMGNQSEATKAAAGAVLGLGGAMLKGGSSLVGFASQAGQIATAMKLIGVNANIAAIGVAGLGVAFAAVAAVGIITYLNAQEKAHEEEARAIFDASESYEEYVQRLEDAGLGSYELSEALYGVAKSADEAGAAIDAIELKKARTEYQHLFQEIEGLADEWERNNQGMDVGVTKAEFLAERYREVISKMTGSELVLAANREEMFNLGLEIGMTGQEAAEFADVVVELAERMKNVREFERWADDATDLRDEMAAVSGETVDLLDEEKRAIIEARREEREQTAQTEQAIKNFAHAVGLSYEQVKEMLARGMDQRQIAAFAEDLHLTAYEMDQLAAETGLTHDQIKRLNDMGWGASKIEALADALAAARGQLAGFFGQLAGGLSDLSGLEQDISDAGASYEQSLADINAAAGRELAGVRQKFESSLPDPTDVSERMGMVADAWDEFALRMGSVQQEGAGSQWFDELSSALAGTEYAFDASKESVSDWANRVREAFYQGDLSEFVNRDAEAWQEHAATVGAAMGEETAAIQSGAAQQRAALQEAYEQQQAELEAALNKKRIAVALAAAETSGALQEWAASTFGPELAGAFDTAAEVMAGLESGLLPLEQGLGDLLSGILTGLDDVKTATAEVAAENEAGLQELATGQWVTDAEQALGGLKEDLEKTLDFAEVMDVGTIQEKIGDIQAEMDKVEESVPPEETMDPFFEAITRVHDYLGTGPMSGPAKIEADEFNAAMADITASITGIPPLHETAIREYGGKKVEQQAIDIKKAMEEIPKLIEIHITAQYDGTGATEWTNSIALEQALQDVADTAAANFPLDLSVGVSSAGGTGGATEGIIDLIDLIRALGVELGETNMERLANLAGQVIAILEMFANASSAMKEIGEYSALDSATLELLASDLRIAVKAMVDVMYALEGWGVPFAAEWANSVQGLVNVIGTAVDSLSSISEYESSGEIGEAASVVGDDLAIAIQALWESLRQAESLTPESLASAKHLAETFRDIVDAVGGSVESLAALGEYRGQAKTIYDRALSVGSDLAEAVKAISKGLTGSGEMSEEALEEAWGLASFANAIVSAVAGTVDALVGVAQYERDAGLEKNAYALGTDVAIAMEHMIAGFEAAAKTSEETLEAAEEFASTAGSIVGVVGRSVDALADVARYEHSVGLAAKALMLGQDLVTTVRYMITGFLLAGTLSQEMIDAAADFSESAGRAAEGVGQAVGALMQIGQYRGISSASLALLISDLLDLLSGVWLMAEALDEAQRGALADVGEMLSSIGGGVQSVFDALVNIGSYRGGATARMDLFFSEAQELKRRFEQLEGGAAPDTAYLEAMARGVNAIFDALVNIGGYRGGIGTGLSAMIADIQELIRQLELLGESLPEWLRPGSPPPLATAMRDVARANREMLHGFQQTNVFHLGGNTFTSTVEVENFEGRVERVVARAVRGW